ncbi:U-box domain-containing protein 34 isoform X2 [Malania oleifera]|uniref:U-box domain-containing protein 34 isoform X2 n=1 Tax=Malania oleifera TaxID=397392 RepID=UPI0025AEA3BA|nr:U-box domain-containing protein 34 isoform X2 [Malania oleifera]
MTTVAVAVRGDKRGRAGGQGSHRAVHFAVENLLPQADRFILVHVMPAITSIPTPLGNNILIKDLDANVVAMYVQDMRSKSEEIFTPFKKLCKTDKVETLVLEDDKPANALQRYISETNISSLVLGSCSLNFIWRKFKGPTVPSTVLRYARDSCEIYVVSKSTIITREANHLTTNGTSARLLKFTQREFSQSYSGIHKQISKFHSSMDSNVHKTFEASSISESSFASSQAFMHKDSCKGAVLELGMSAKTLGDGDLETRIVEQCNSLASANSVQVQLVSSECLEEARRVKAALEREEALRKVVVEEKAKYLEAMKEVELARSLLAKEVYERQMVELSALKDSSERQKIVDALLLSDKRYKMYTRNQIESATDFFSESNVIGEGGYGKVYRCNLDHTPVAVKVLHPDASPRKEEFLREVEVLSRLHHPHLVLLLGACPESGCLIYEYMENGNLEEHILQKKGRPPLPWFVRFRIVFEIACGLAFLHGAKPEPIVHRDLKPGNILLDRNYVSKISDVGMAKLISDVVPDSVTAYRDSMLAGTLFYMDPEYQRTGTLRPKSDLYALGVIIFQLLAGRHPKGLLSIIENAISNANFADVLDKSVSDWPLAETEELAHIALKCSRLRCRDRPDLDTEVMPVLKKLADIADASAKVGRDNFSAPSHFFCPILQVIMEDPHIAADGFSYEHRAMKAWLERHNVSPVTKLRLKHTTLTPNHTLHAAIQQWRLRMKFSGV